MTTVATRACHFCKHMHVDDSGDLRCFAYAVNGASTKGKPLTVARSLDSACGPEARFLEFPEFISRKFNPEQEIRL